MTLFFFKHSDSPFEISHYCYQQLDSGTHMLPVIIM
jgi:hypothetical protein